MFKLCIEKLDSYYCDLCQGIAVSGSTLKSKMIQERQLGFKLLESMERVRWCSTVIKLTKKSGQNVELTGWPCCSIKKVIQFTVQPHHQCFHPWSLKVAHSPCFSFHVKVYIFVAYLNVFSFFSPLNKKVTTFAENKRL